MSAERSAATPFKCSCGAEVTTPTCGICGSGPPTVQDHEEATCPVCQARLANEHPAATTLRDDLALVRLFVESNGYGIVVLEDGEGSAFPMKTEPVLAALGRIAEALSRV